MKKILRTYIAKPVSAFITHSSSGGIVLLISALAALIVANSPWQENYHHWWESRLTIGWEGFSFSKTTHHWINDGLMALFFFVVGLELKREVIGGELSRPKDALLPILAGIGGMVVPAVFYVVFNSGLSSLDGWGVPMATDIAFALGIIYLLGDRVPTPVKVFLTALAIADDIGAVLVIAFFYSSDISIQSLVAGLVGVGVLGVGNMVGIRSSWFYGVIGILVVWVAFVLSGVHATIAGILAAFMIPANVKIPETKLALKMKSLAQDLENAESNDITLVTDAQWQIISEMRKLTKWAMTPLQRLEHALHPVVAFFIMPLFAFANAGVSLEGLTWETVGNPVTLGILTGLFLGKPIGIVGISWLTIRLGWAKLPNQTSWSQLIGVAFLGGVGFTMSLFVTDLAFTSSELITQAKVGILIASLVAGVVGFWLLRKSS